MICAHLLLPKVLQLVAKGLMRLRPGSRVMMFIHKSIVQHF